MLMYSSLMYKLLMMHGSNLMCNRSWMCTRLNALQIPPPCPSECYTGYIFLIITECTSPCSSPHLLPCSHLSRASQNANPRAPLLITAITLRSPSSFSLLKIRSTWHCSVLPPSSQSDTWGENPRTYVVVDHKDICSG